MYVVYIEDDRHSAWKTLREAKHHADTLAEYGYKNVTVQFRELCTYSGYYFV